MDKLFTNLNLDSFDEKSIEQALSDELLKSKVFFTIRYSVPGQILVYKLWVTFKGQTKSLLSNAVPDQDGTVTFYLGEYDDSDEIEISFGVIAYTVIEKAIALISQNNPPVAFQLDPSTPGQTNKIELDKPWRKTLKYKVR